jgi:plasmid stability protein
MNSLQNEFMKVITIRGVPDDVHRTLTRLAARNRRSLQQQVLVLLESACRLPDGSPVRRAAAIRRSLGGRELGDTVREIRDERNR